MRWVSRLTTVALLVVIVAAGALVIRSLVPNAQVGQGFVTSARFRDASRLAAGSPVIIAGVRVGDITGLTIDGPVARVEMRLRDDIKLPADTFATRRADSLFGDSYVELIPGGPGPEDGSGAAPIRLLRSGEPITHVQEGGSTDAFLRSVGRALPRIDNALDNVHDFMADGRRVVAGPVLSRIEGADRWLAEGHLEGPLATADRAMERFESATTRGADAVAEAAPNIKRRLSTFDQDVASATRRIREVRDSLITGFADARAGFDRIDPVVEQMAEVTQAIDRGSGDDWRGTLGRLVNEHELADTLDDGTATIAEATGGLDRFRSWLGITVEGSPFSAQTRFLATAQINTRTDKFYLVELEKSDLGGAPSDALIDQAGSPSFTRVQAIEDKLRFTAQFGKRLGWLQVRGGLKLSTIGAGADALLLGGQLRLSADVFGAFEAPPRIRLVAALAVFKSIYVHAGVDDVLNAPRDLPLNVGNTPVPVQFDSLRTGRDYFFGASIRFDDLELTTLLRVYGALALAAVGT